MKFCVFYIATESIKIISFVYHTLYVDILLA